MIIKYTIQSNTITKAHKFMNYTYTGHSISPTCFSTLGHLQRNTIPIHARTHTRVCVCVCVYLGTFNIKWQQMDRILKTCKDKCRAFLDTIIIKSSDCQHDKPLNDSIKISHLQSHTWYWINNCWRKYLVTTQVDWWSYNFLC